MRQNRLYARIMLHRTMETARALWCEFFHDQAMWPINGRYQCRTCLRYTEVPWEGTNANSTVQKSDRKLQVVSRTSAAAASRV